MPFLSETSESTAGFKMEACDARAASASLPVRTTRQQDEWIETYLGRAVRAFGVLRPWRPDLEVLRRMLPQTMARTDDGRPVYGTEMLPGWAAVGRQAQIRVCAQCFLEGRYVRARWRIPFLTVCTAHGIVLKDGLVEPAITAAYKRPGKRAISDVTDDEVAEGATCPTPTGLNYARMIWQPFEHAVCSGEAPDVVSDRLAWALLAERMIDAAVTAHRGPDYPTRDVPRHEHRGRWLRKERLHITPDRAGVLAFLLDQGGSSRRRAILAALARLIGDECRTHTIMSRLPLVELRERLLAAAPVGERPGSGALPRALHPSGCKSFEAVEAILGCPPDMLSHLLQEGHFQGVTRIQFGRKRYIFVPDAEVDRVRRLFATYVTFNELLEELAIDKRTYWALHDAGYVPPIELGSWRRYRRQDVSALLSRLDSASRPSPEPSVGLQPLMGDWLHMCRRPRACIAKILEDILDGRVPLYKRLDKEGMQAYFVGPAALTRLLSLSEAHRAANRSGRNSTTQSSLWEET